MDFYYAACLPDSDTRLNLSNQQQLPIKLESNPGLLLSPLAASTASTSQPSPGGGDASTNQSSSEQPLPQPPTLQRRKRRYKAQAAAAAAQIYKAPFDHRQQERHYIHQHQGLQGQHQHQELQGQHQHQGLQGQHQHQGLQGQHQHQGLQGQHQHQGLQGQHQHQGLQGQTQHQELQGQHQHQALQGQHQHQGLLGQHQHQGLQGQHQHQGLQGQHQHHGLQGQHQYQLENLHLQQQQLCSVCGDRALGFNFDAVTCESCKAFFRRNAVKEKEQRCNFDGNCDVSVATRKFCPACRLNKCFRVGMKKEWILDAAQLQQRRERARRSPPLSQQLQQPQGPPQRLTVLLLLSPDDEPSQPHFWNLFRPLTSVCESLLSTVSTALAEVMDNVDSSDSNKIRRSGAPDCAGLETPFAITLSFVQRFVQFVQRLPEYSLISKEDMSSLIKGGVYHLTLMRGAITYSPEEDSFQFESNRLGGLHQLPLNCLSQSMSTWPGGQGLLSRYRDFLIASVNASHNDRLALTLLQLIDFYNPARPNVSDMRLIDMLQTGYTQLLRRYIQSKWRIEETRAVYYNLLNWLSELDKLAMEFSEKGHSVVVNSQKLDKLLIEVFELHPSQ